jgi:hypothetical protein
MLLGFVVVVGAGLLAGQCRGERPGRGEPAAVSPTPTAPR